MKQRNFENRFLAWLLCCFLVLSSSIEVFAGSQTVYLGGSSGSGSGQTGNWSMYVGETALRVGVHVRMVSNSLR